MAFETEPRWDVSVALGDVTFDIHRHRSAGSTPDREELTRWQASLAKAGTAFNNLLLACEDIVELGVSDERIAAKKQALTRAEGQAEYCTRKDRW